MRMGPYSMRPLSGLEGATCAVCRGAVTAGEKYFLESSFARGLGGGWSYAVTHATCGGVSGYLDSKRPDIR